MTELRDVICHMGSHSVTCYPTQVNATALTPARKRVLDLPTRIGVNNGGGRGGRVPPINHSAGDANVIHPPDFDHLRRENGKI